jgi:hypothetical protein
MADQTDFIARVLGQLNEKVKILTEKLVAAPASGHDLLAGQIQAYQSIIKYIETEGKKWRLDDKED